MPYSLTINFTPPTGDGYQFVTEYRIKFWPTSSPTNVSTVFTNAFPLVLTDLNFSSYSGTIEAKCGANYGTPRSFGPIVIAGGGSGGATPACPYRVVLYEDESVSYAIGASGNTTSCVKPGYRIKLTTEGGALVTTSTPITVNLDYTVETGDCASPTNTQTISTTLNIPASSSTSTGYLQVSQSNQRISNVSFGTGNPTTLVNGTLTCNLTYTGGGTALATRTVYLNAKETGTGSNVGIQWFLSNSADGSLLPLGQLLPFNLEINYIAHGYGASGRPSYELSEIDINNLDIMAGENTTSQGATSYNWFKISDLTIQFSTPSDPNMWSEPIDVFSGSGGTINNPVTYLYNGTLYYIQIYRHYSVAS